MKFPSAIIFRSSIRILGIYFASLLFLQTIIAQPANDDCVNATPINIVTEYDFYTLTGTTVGGAPDVVNSPCVIQGFSTVWYVLRTSDYAAFMNVHVNSWDKRKIPVIRLFKGVVQCNEWTSVENGIADPACFYGVEGHVEIINLSVEPEKTYYLAVTILHPEGAEFEISVNNFPLDPGCARKNTLEIFRTSGLPVFTPFLRGEEVEICMKVSEFSAAGNGCQWFQGLVPVFGDGWSTDEPENQRLNENFVRPFKGVSSQSKWDWFTDVDYHHTNPFLQIGDKDGNGSPDICNLLNDPYCFDFGGVTGGCCGPCWGQPVGTLLPGGWFAYGVNGTCPLPGPPIRHDWGDGSTCGYHEGGWEFCFTKRVVENISCGEEYDLSTTFYTFTDGEIGSWSGNAFVCFGDLQPETHLPMICNDVVSLDTILNPTVTDVIEICSGDTIYLDPADYVANHSNILFWRYILYESSYYSGIMAAADSIILTGTHSGFNPRIITLHLYGHASLQSLATFRVFKLIIHSASNANFTFKVNPSGVKFESNFAGPWTHSWSFGDGDSSALVHPSHSYTKGGKYLVRHIVDGRCGRDTVEKWVDIPPQIPNALLEIPNQSYCPGDTIQIKNQSTGIVDSVFWIAPESQIIFYDSSVMWLVYSSEGTFDVGLVAYNGDGSDTIYYKDAIQVTPSPDASFSYNLIENNAFFWPTIMGNWDHTWIFGDGSESNDPNPQITYGSGGEFTVTHIIHGACGSDTSAQIVIIPHQLPNPAIDIPVGDFCINDTIELFNYSTGSIDSISWFVPGAQIVSADSVHIQVSYNAPGQFSIGMNAYNPAGTGSVLYEDTLHVLGVPQANFIFGVFDLFVQFQYSGSPSDNVQWFLGDSIALNGLLAEKQFDSTGTYPCMLIASNMCGADTNLFNLTLIPTGISFIDENSDFRVNPNPTSDVVNIVYAGESTSAVLRIYNAIGQVLYSDHSFSETRDLTLSLRDLGLTGGVACFVFETSEKKYVRRVLVVY